MTDVYHHDQEESESLISKYLGSDSEESSEDTSRATPEEQAHQVINKSVEAIAESIETGRWDIIYSSFSTLSDSFGKYHRMLRGEMPRNWLLAMHRVLETFAECSSSGVSNIARSNRKYFNSLKTFLEDEKNQPVVSYVRVEYDAYLKKQLEDATESQAIGTLVPTVEIKRDDGLNVARILRFFCISFEPENEHPVITHDDKAAPDVQEAVTSIISGHEILKVAILYINKHNFAQLHAHLLRSDSPRHILHAYILFLERLVATGCVDYPSDVQACLRCIFALLQQNDNKSLLGQVYDDTAQEPSLSTPFVTRLLTGLSGLSNLYELKDVIYYLYLSVFISYYSINGKLESTIFRTVANYAKNLLRDGCSATVRYGDVLNTYSNASKSTSIDPLTLVPTYSGDVSPLPQSSELLRTEFTKTFPEASKIFTTYLAGHVFFRSKYLYLLYVAGTKSTGSLDSNTAIPLPEITEEFVRKAPREGIPFPFTKEAISEDRGISESGDKYDEVMEKRHWQLSYIRLAIACSLDNELSPYTYDLFMSEQEHTVEDARKIRDSRHTDEVRLLALNHTDIDYIVLRLHYCIGIKAFANGRMHQASMHLLLISNLFKGERQTISPFLPSVQAFEAESIVSWLDSDLIEAACLLSTLCSKFALLHNRAHTVANQHLAPLQRLILQKILQLVDVGRQVSATPYEYAIALAFKCLSHGNHDGAINAIITCPTWRCLRYYNTYYERCLEEAIKVLSLKFWIMNYHTVVSSTYLADLAKAYGLSEDKIKTCLRGVSNIQIKENIVEFLT
ncbi:Hypothetical protein GLP15_1687 [Giardia lamblia P15]|uniref:Uncharacterized protein n=1 Tax=Giardia intestinalis (strain P15) TaxID=658858 RepID=E1EW07_GIAIA|nr:Hypothetical protein GLP15_1687 [Giardia lamblia P15]